jgi:hypothetical protein
MYSSLYFTIDVNAGCFGVRLVTPIFFQFLSKSFFSRALLEAGTMPFHQKAGLMPAKSCKNGAGTGEIVAEILLATCGMRIKTSIFLLILCRFGYLMI